MDVVSYSEIVCDPAVTDVKTLGDLAQPNLSSLLMIPTRIEDGSTPRIIVTIMSYSFPVMLDSGFEVRTFGTSTVTLRGPVPLEVQLCGIKVPHLFYFADMDVPALIGYDLMRAARLVVDVDNRLVWSRRLHSSVPTKPNPSVTVENPTVQACVSFFEGSGLFDVGKGGEAEFVLSPGQVFDDSQSNDNVSVELCSDYVVENSVAAVDDVVQSVSSSDQLVDDVLCSSQIVESSVVDVCGEVQSVSSPSQLVDVRQSVDDVSLVLSSSQSVDDSTFSKLLSACVVTLSQLWLVPLL